MMIIGGKSAVGIFLSMTGLKVYCGQIAPPCGEAIFCRFVPAVQSVTKGSYILFNSK
jgi:hypothetical protein